ncbi:Atxe2 family lasso peptide isopeptidase [Novosphingobium fluoreni]|uniref:Atxe2 family lasso peptide isopeptidase n=1 Tax=Novosphingobium fluoreni TaxID=1391222 RepID=UPI003DA033D5
MRELIELTDLSSVAISPDGRMAAFREENALIERNVHELAWFVVPVDGSASPRRLADAGEGNWLNGTLLSEPPLWSADSRFILYRAVIDGEVQVWRAAADGSSVARITQEPGNLIDIAPGPDPHTVLFREGAARDDIARAERRDYDEGVLVDASVDPSRPLYRGARIDGRQATERLKGFWFGHGGLLADRPPRVRVLDIVSGAVRDASQAEAATLAPQTSFFDRLGGRFLIARAAAGDARGTGYVLSSGTTHELLVARGPGLAGAIPCTAPQCTGQRIRALAWQQGADALVFETRDGLGNSTLYRWNVKSGTVTTLARGAGTLNGGRDDSEGCAIGARTMVCIAAAADMPPRLVAIDLDSGAMRSLVEPNRALADPDLRFRPLEWQDGVGRRFSGQLLLPAAKNGPVPLFVTYYSCSGYLRGGLGDEFPLREFARHGIAALCINRFPAPDGVGDQVGAYRIAQSGVAAAIALLARENLVDPTRVGMGGVSFGGESTIWIAMHSRLLAAMSIANELLTPTYYWFNAVEGREVPEVLRSGWGIGDPDHDRRGWRALSPAFNTDRIHIPLLMQLPELEYRPNVELLARLQRAHTPVELWAFPGEVHIKWQPRHQLAANVRNLDWFRFWLTGEIDPDPRKAEQYRRWEAYRRSAAGSGSSQPRTQASASITGSRR